MTPRNLPLSLSTISPSPPAGVLRSMFRAEHPYERADHLADSLARRAVRFVFSQLPLSRFEGSFSVAFTVVCAPLAAFMRTGKVVVFRRGLWRDPRVSALEECQGRRENEAVS